MRKWLLLVICILPIKELCSQTRTWTRVAQNLFVPYLNGVPEFGSIAANNDIVIAGWQKLFLSTDQGSTWKELILPGMGGVIEDVDIFNELVFAVYVSNRGVFYTNDQGNSWVTLSTNGNGRSLVFGNAPDKVHFVTSGTTITTKVNGVTTATWSASGTQYISSLEKAADGSLRAFIYFPGNECGVYSSTNDGVSWQGSRQLNSDQDSYNFITDQDDPNRMVFVNEEWAVRRDNASEIYLTTDNGTSWRVTYSGPLSTYTDLVGNATKGCSEYYVGTARNGILCSTDKGETWSSIGGPETPVDSRSIAAVDDGLLYAIDVTGSIWKSVTSVHTGGGASITGAELFQTTKFTTCDTPVTCSIILHDKGCGASEVLSAELIGSDIADYEILQDPASPPILPDTIIVRFTPIRSDTTDAQLKLTLANGDIRFINLNTIVEPAPVTFGLPSFFYDSINVCAVHFDTIKLTSPCDLTLSVALIGEDSSCFSVVSASQIRLPQDSLLIISSRALLSGELDAEVILTASNGDIWKIQLFKIADEQERLSLKLELLSTNTDTIGGDVTLRLTLLEGMPSPGTRFSIHYDTGTLQYLGTFNTDMVDRTIYINSQFRPRVQFADSVLYIQFALFPTSSLCSDIRLDSLTTSSNSECLLVDSFSAPWVCASEFCGRGMLTKWLRDRSIPKFSITPNPSANDLTLHSSDRLSDVHIQIIDALGATLFVGTMDLRPTGTSLPTRDLHPGVYTIQISSSTVNARVRFVKVE